MATIYVEAKKASRIVASTHLKVDISEWNNRNEDMKGFFDKHFTLATQMKEIELALDTLVSNEGVSKAEVDEVISGIAFRDTQKALAEDKARREEAARIKAGNPVNLLAEYVDELKSGKRLLRGRKYSKGTILNWVSFQKVFLDFYQMNPFQWKSLDARLIDNFVSCMIEQYMAKTTNKNLTAFRTLAGYAQERGFLTYEQVVNAFKRKSVEVDVSDKRKEIFLTAEEIQALFDMSLTGMEDKVRDSFLVGVYTCQRVSDFTKIMAEDFRTTRRDTKVVDVRQTKTRTKVTIPVLNDNLLLIAKKYNYDLPKLSPAVLNRTIKEILKRLSASVPSLAEKEVTVLSAREKKMEAEGKVIYERNRRGEALKPRYDLVSTHTARRSGITNLYLSGRFDNYQMRSISGHKDEGIFLSYIKLSGDDVADLIKEKQTQTKDDDSIF